MMAAIFEMDIYDNATNGHFYLSSLFIKEHRCANMKQNGRGIPTNINTPWFDLYFLVKLSILYAGNTKWLPK